MADVKICDRCGKILNDVQATFELEPKYYSFAGKLMDKYTTYNKDRYHSFDFCKKCVEDLVTWIEKKPGKETE